MRIPLKSLEREVDHGVTLVVGKVQRNFLVKPVDEEIKELVFVDFIVCLLFGVHILSKQTF
jgi:hypothetical protein